MPIKIPPIREFPKDGRIWRIDWLGAVERAAPEALIEVFLSSVRDGIRWPREQKHFDRDTVRAQVGVGQLPFLAIGSLWRDRSRLDQSAGFSVHLRDIRIDAKCVRLVDAGTKLEVDRWLIPPFEHRLPKSTFRSLCLAIEYNGDPYGILLPVAEAIRFYYAVSTDLAHVVFNGALQLDRNSVIDISFSGMLRDTEQMVLRLRQWLADDDGWIIGRMIADPLAEAGVARIYDSLMRNSANSRAAYPECSLPFEGTTAWHARGVSFAVEGQQARRWLIFELRSCSAPFPFRELEIVRDNDGRRADPETDLAEEEKQLTWSGPVKSASVTPGTELQSSESPEAGIVPVKIPLAGERFGDLVGKAIIKSVKDQCRYKSDSFRTAVIAGALGTGIESSATTGVAPARAKWNHEVDVARRKGLPASFETLMQVVEALNATPCVTATIRPGTSGVDTLPRTKPSRMQQWSYLDFNMKIWRRVMVVDIACSNRYAHLIEFEQRKTEHYVAALIVSRGVKELSDAMLLDLLHGLTRARGVWGNVSGHRADVRIVLFKHTRTSPAMFAAAISQAMHASLRSN